MCLVELVLLHGFNHFFCQNTLPDFNNAFKLHQATLSGCQFPGYSAQLIPPTGTCHHIYLPISNMVKLAYSTYSII